MVRDGLIAFCAGAANAAEAAFELLCFAEWDTQDHREIARYIVAAQRDFLHVPQRTLEHRYITGAGTKVEQGHAHVSFILRQGGVGRADAFEDDASDLNAGFGGGVAKGGAKMLSHGNG